MSTVLSVRFEVGVSLLLASAGADKRGPKAPFLLVDNAGKQPRVPPELWRESGLTESTVSIPTLLDISRARVSKAQVDK